MIQWYPGHMHKANKEFKKILPKVDLVIEVLDARIPFSSENPLLAKLRGDKPCIKLLNKSDLADAEALKEWQRYLEQDRSIKTLACNIHDRSILGLPDLCRVLIPARRNRSTMIYAFIAGIPNVGKSTLINRLAQRSIAKTGNEAALTRMQQRVEISSDLTLIDTPGVLWPNIENSHSGYRLAATGAIRDTAIDLQEVACFIAEFLLLNHASATCERYALDALPASEIDLLEAIGKKRGCFKSGGIIDLEKVSRLLISELRNGDLGPLCLETPEMMIQELKQVEMIRQEKRAKLALRKGTRR